MARAGELPRALAVGCSAGHPSDLLPEQIAVEGEREAHDRLVAALRRLHHEVRELGLDLEPAGLLALVGLEGLTHEVALLLRERVVEVDVTHHEGVVVDRVGAERRDRDGLGDAGPEGLGAELVREGGHGLSLVDPTKRMFRIDNTTKGYFCQFWDKSCDDFCAREKLSPSRSICYDKDNEFTRYRPSL